MLKAYSSITGNYWDSQMHQIKWIQVKKQEVLTFNINSDWIRFCYPMFVLSFTVVFSTLWILNWWERPFWPRMRLFIFKPGEGGLRTSFGRASESHVLSFFDNCGAYFSQCFLRSICVNKLNSSKEKSVYIEKAEVDCLRKTNMHKNA